MQEFINPSQVFLDAEAATRDEALAFLADQAVAAGVADDAAAVLDAYKAREAEGSTGMVGVFALPHAKSDAVKSPAVFVVRFKEPVTDWLSMDKTPVEVAIGLVMPQAEAHSTHLRLLSNLAVALMQPDFREHLENAADAEAVAAVINERLSE